MKKDYPTVVVEELEKVINGNTEYRYDYRNFVIGKELWGNWVVLSWNKDVERPTKALKEQTMKELCDKIDRLLDCNSVLFIKSLF